MTISSWAALPIGIIGYFFPEQISNLTYRLEVIFMAYYYILVSVIMILSGIAIVLFSMRYYKTKYQIKHLYQKVERLQIKQLNNSAERKVKEMIGKNILDSEVDKLRFKSSGRVNWWGLSKLLGCSDKKAKDLILRHAPYLHRDDEMGYLK